MMAHASNPSTPEEEARELISRPGQPQSKIWASLGYIPRQCLKKVSKKKKSLDHVCQGLFLGSPFCSFVLYAVFTLNHKLCNKL